MNTPVAFVVFNRPDCTVRTLRAIRDARPDSLYVIADGPRPGNSKDLTSCAKVREIVAAGVDWPCHVEYNYSDHNLGCAERVAGGLTWAFSRSERLIVVEDDCLPNPTFFPFCEELLIRYADDTRIGQICGGPFITNTLLRPTSYIFSRYGPIWGWASWARAWKHYDIKIGSWSRLKESGDLKSVIPNAIERRLRRGLYNKLATGKASTWDYQWGYAKLVNSMLSVIPTVSMIENIGFGEEATHTSSSQSFLQRHAVPFPLSHPETVIPDASFDELFSIATCGHRRKKILARSLHWLNRALAGKDLAHA